MKKIAVLILCLMAVSAKAHREDPRPDRPSIQLALLLDTSNSMDGLIGQAKSQLWRVVNDLASAKCRGYAPRIEVALYEYGNSRLSAGESYLRQVLPFTNDLDRVSEQLFGLRTNGGEEYCGAVIKDAVRNLNWDNRAQVYKTIFIAGNEPFTQGNVNFRDAIQRAVDKGILVNTIFCGNRREGIETAWQDGAQRGRGDFLTINQDDPVAVLHTPYDDEIERLGRALNDTYVYYGSEGRQAWDRRGRADSEALKMAPAGASVERSLFKSKSQYAESVAEKDAVSQVASGALAPSAIKKEDLPENYRGKNTKELETLLKAKNTEREKIQKQLNALGEKRSQHLAAHQTAGESTLDKALLNAVRTQAGLKGFTFPQ